MRLNAEYLTRSRGREEFAHGYIKRFRNESDSLDGWVSLTGFQLANIILAYADPGGELLLRKISRRPEFFNIASENLPHVHKHMRRPELYSALFIIVYIS